MKRSAINLAFHHASACFQRNGWTLPPAPKWDITDFGLAYDLLFQLVSNNWNLLNPLKLV